MPRLTPATTRITATVDQVLPQFGIAYLHDDDSVEWAVTRSTVGHGLAALQPGDRLALVVERHADFAIVSEYTALR